MSERLNAAEPAVGPGATPVSSKAIQRILKTIEENHLTPKSFLEAWLSSNDPAITKSQRPWSSVGTGLQSTARLLCAIRDTVIKTKAGRVFWEDWVISQAVILAKDQHPPSRMVPKGFYINTSKVTPSMFDHGDVHNRDKRLEESMSFLYTLIQKILLDSQESRLREANVRKTRLERKKTDCDTHMQGLLQLEDLSQSSTSALSSTMNPSSQSTNPHLPSELDINRLGSEDESELDLDPKIPTMPMNEELGGGTIGEDNEYVHSWDGYVFRKSKDLEENVKTRSASVTQTICSMVANVCNRRVNALQVENGLTFLACGVSERVNAYLNYIGISVNRRTAIHALEHIGQELKKKIVDVMGEDHWLAPFITLDNIDFQQHVHTPTVQKESTMCNGSWGYIHRPKIPEGISSNQETFTAQKLNDILNDAEQKPIDINDIQPSPTEIKDWNLTLKSQISHALLKYIAEPIDNKKIPYRHPPAVLELPAEKPDIMMLKMMSASDNSTAGVGDLYNAVLQQTGLSREKYASRAQVWEGDLGTAQIVSSVVEERDPCIDPAESFQHILMILGAAHVMWNVSQAILLEHWGTHLDRADMGAWRGIEALGGQFDKPTSKKDFTAMIRSIERLHEGSITLCIQRVMKLNVETVSQERVKMTPEKMKNVIDETFDRYFGPKAIQRAKEESDDKLIRFLLRLQDFATVVEASRSMSAGDVGRMIRMWKRWSVMAHGMNRLKHYANYLPRLIILLNKTLPKDFADIIRFNLLVCPSGRAGHFVAKDFFLEVQNFWLKFFYNNVGAGTSIKRLRDLYSINIPLLRELLHRLKGRSGLNDAYQSHHNIIDLSSMRNFLRMAHQHNIAAGTPGSTLPSGRPNDMYAKGIERLSELAREKKLDRFHWPKACGSHPQGGPARDSSLNEDEESSDRDSLSD